MAWLAVVLVSNFLCVSAMMMFIPLIGPLFRLMGLADWHIGLTVTAGGLGWMLFSHYWGKLSDRRGRRGVLSLCIFAFAFCYVGIASYVFFVLDNPQAVIVSLVVMVMLRGVLGIFYAGIPTILTSTISTNTSRESRGRYLALFGASGAIAMVSGPALGGYLTVYSFVLPLVVASAFPFLAAILMLVALPKDAAKPRAHEQSSARLLDPRLRLPMFGIFAAMSSVMVAQISIGLFAIDVLHVTKVESAIISAHTVSVIGIMLIVAQALVVHLRNIRSESWLCFGAIVGALGFGSILFGLIAPPNYGEWILVGGNGLAALGMGTMFPSLSAIAANRVDEHEQGTAAGSMSFSQGMGMVIAPIAGTLLYRVSPFMPYLVVAMMLLTLFPLFLRNRLKISHTGHQL